MHVVWLRVNKTCAKLLDMTCKQMSLVGMAISWYNYPDIPNILRLELLVAQLLYDIFEDHAVWIQHFRQRGIIDIMGGQLVWRWTILLILHWEIMACTVKLPGDEEYTRMIMRSLGINFIYSYIKPFW